MMGKRHGLTRSAFVLAILAISFHSALAGAKVRAKCKDRVHCNHCLKSKKGPGTCAWFVDAEGEGRCISEKKCDKQRFQNGSCTKSSVTFNWRKTCRRIRKEPSRNNDEGNMSCEKFSGLCTDCLSNGCSWLTENLKCVKTCDGLPTDVGPCKGATPNPFPNEIPEMCADLKLQYLNRELCQKAGNSNRGCKKCVTTKLYPDINDPPTCQWRHQDRSCFPAGDHGILGPGTDNCDCPPKDQTWSEFLGEDYQYATWELERTYCDELIIQVIKPGESYTEDYRLDRVRLFVDANDKIKEIPKVG